MACRAGCVVAINASAEESTARRGASVVGDRMCSASERAGSGGEIVTLANPTLNPSPYTHAASGFHPFASASGFGTHFSESESQDMNLFLSRRSAAS